jgi:hypothetical protein
MTVPRKKSRKPSATSDSPPESASEAPVILFLDRAIDSHSIATALREAGADIRRHRDEFRDDEDDAVWLPEVGRRGWFVLTRDARIRYNPLEIQALRTALVGAFVFVPKNLTGPEMAIIIAGALPAIERAARRTERPFIIKIHRNGTLKAIDLDG